jgi:hypothetical protein
MDPLLAGTGRRLTRTERNWLLSAAILVGSMLIFQALYAYEMDLGRWDAGIRLVAEPAEAATRYVAIAHFLLAFLFIGLSPRMRKPRALAGIVALLAVGALLSGGFSFLERTSPVLASYVFFAYFVLHDFRDQAFFYRVNGDCPAPEGERATTRLILGIPFLAIGGLTAVLAFLASVRFLGHEPVGEGLATLPVPVRVAIGLLPAVVVGIGFMLFRRLWRTQRPGALEAFVRRHRPVFAVFAGSILATLLGMFLSWRLHTIVILHVAAWYIFTVRRLAAAPARSRGPGRWLTATPSGFTVLHSGLVVALVLLGVLWAYAFRNDPGVTPLQLLLSPRYFRYFTIVHVTVSFAR